jgi:hypothetical protein
MMVQNIIDSKEGEKNIDAYDILAECLEATGDMEGAMYVMKDSAAVIPSARRQRLVAEAAYLNGDLETAKECYARLAKATSAEPQRISAIPASRFPSWELPVIGGASGGVVGPGGVGAGGVGPGGVGVGGVGPGGVGVGVGVGLGDGLGGSSGLPARSVSCAIPHGWVISPQRPSRSASSVARNV